MVREDRKCFDVAAMGELLIDFTPCGLSDQGNAVYECNPGGAPANVLAVLSKWGKKTAFLGKVGNDSFGAMLTDTLEKTGIDTTGLRISDGVPTTLAFVRLEENGERSFSFYRKPGADVTFELADLDFDILNAGKVFHFGSVSMTADPSRTATLKAAEYAKNRKLLVTYDPNLREALWDSLAEAKEVILEGIKYADILKVSEEEIRFLSGSDHLAESTKLIMKQFDIPLIFVTLGERGCYYRYLDAAGTVPSYRVQAVDTTGAGDIFFGAALFKILENPGGFMRLTIDDVRESIRFANAAGALAAAKRGGIASVPELKEIEELLRKR